MQGLNDVSRFVTSFSGSQHFVLDYLLEEVLQKQSQDVQDFLMQTSILERFCAPLADAVTAREGSQDVLDNLERTGLLLIPLDNKRRWYRYHHLFAGALQARLERLKADHIPELHLRASVWLEQHGLMGEAIHHALAAKAYERAADVIEEEWMLVAKQKFQSPTNLAWLQALPDDVIRQRPVLRLSYAWQLLNFGELDAVEPHLAAAEPQFSKLPTSPEQQAYLASLENARAYLASARQQPERTIHHAERAKSYANDDDDYSQGISSTLIGLAQMMLGQLDDAFARHTESIERWLRAGNLLFAVSPTYALADIRLTQGRLHKAIDCYQATLELAEKRGQPNIQGAAEFHLGLSEIYREQGRAEEAQRHYKQSLTLPENLLSPFGQYRLRVAQASRHQAQGDYEAALKCLADADQVFYPMPLPVRHPIAALKARIWILQGDLDNASVWVRERGLGIHDNLSYPLEFEHITLARLLIAQQRLDDADLLLSRLLAAARLGGRMASVLEVVLLQALLHQAQGDTQAGLRSLTQALQLAEPEGYLQLFLNEGEALQQLLQVAQGQGIATPYIARLLAAMGGFDRTIATPIVTDQFVEPLSGRELEVLRLIAEGLSNQEIAQRLSVSLSTVKGHNHNIFGKLLVQRRTEAVAKARALALL